MSGLRKKGLIERIHYGIARFSVKSLCEKVYPEYKLQPRYSRGSNPGAEIFIVHNQGLDCIADCKHELSARDAIRIKINTGYRIRVSL